MALSATRPRMMSARPRKTYRLEMEGRTLYLLLGLMGATALVVFYLGVVTGMAVRNPNPPLTAQAPAVQQGQPAQAPAAGNLAFNEAMSAKEGGVEGLKVNGEDVTDRTRALLDQARQELELQEVSAGDSSKAADAPAKPAAAAPATPSQPAARQPAAAPPATPSTPSAAASGEYTVQVFSSQHQDRAQALMGKLRDKGFSAYLNRFEGSDNSVWYRVRVGRTSQAQAEALRERLKAEAHLKNPRIIKL